MPTITRTRAAAVRPAFVLAIAGIIASVAVTGCGGGSQNEAVPLSALSTQDTSFVTFAAQSSNSEIALANLALKKSTNQNVTAFAQRMITDHTTANAQLAALASVKQSFGSLPASLLPNESQTLNTLQGVSEPAFDRAYVADQITAHQLTIQMFTTETTAGSATDVKQFATTQLPILQMHLSMAQQLQPTLP